MKTVRRLFYADIVSSVAFVGVAFLSLFFFIDFVDELADAGKRGYTAFYAGVYSALELPGHVYELMPIAVLIGTIYALSRLAQSSEFTILRTGGLGPGRALSLLTTLGLAFGVITFLVGDYVAPLAEEQAAHMQASYKGGLKLGRSGAWLKDRQATPDGERSYSINVGSASGKGRLQAIRIFEFDANGRMLERIAAASGEVDKNSQWTLSDVTVTRWADPGGREAFAEGDVQAKSCRPWSGAARCRQTWWLRPCCRCRRCRRWSSRATSLIWPTTSRRRSSMRSSSGSVRSTPSPAS